MIKKEYQKPTMNVVKIQQQAHLLAGSITGIQSAAPDSDTDWTDDDAFTFGGGNSGSGR